MAKKGNNPRDVATGGHEKFFEFCFVAMDASTLFRYKYGMNSVL
ncbi:MAG: hypothetical protein ACYDAO_06295 [Thermoplasmataceae archaeon]